MVTTVSGQVNQPDYAPTLEFFKAGAHVGTGDFQDLLDLLGVERFRRQVEQRVNLGHRAIDAPLGTHLTPVEDEPPLGVGELAQRLHFC